ncbi:hypothetical protein NQ117_05555 [Paenibacillus sp. SC116]|uniref:hypothetical protein n=1 Tax=Paenibacillus sp. SC116 TaxID=2968986 RepID=UPI00215A7BCF|nr:hypothetical protein [Paenibacillus sp. SC116]MCR8843139.1 hypothetical protein [Paenibacillus sp. SC116]
MSTTTEKKRDLHADLAICDAATSGPWNIADTTDGFYVLDADDYVLAATLEHAVDATFIVEARQGWPEAIRRAIVAEAEVERLQCELTMALDGPVCNDCQNGEVPPFNEFGEGDDCPKCCGKGFVSHERAAELIAEQCEEIEILHEALTEIIEVSKADGIAYELDQCYVIARGALSVGGDSRK